jgi:hypothetical protein
LQHGHTLGLLHVISVNAVQSPNILIDELVLPFYFSGVILVPYVEHELPIAYPTDLTFLFLT